SEDETGEKLYTVTQNAVDAARADGADYVIAMSHLGIEADCSPWTSSEVINNTTGIDVCLDAHSHTVIPGETVKNKDGEDVLLTSTGTKLAYVGVLTIDEDGTFHTMLIDESAVAYAELIGALSDDGGIGEVVDSINAEFAELINQVVAHSDVDLITQDPANEDVRIIRNQETNLGDLCADAYRSLSGAQIAFVNGGGIRKSIPAGDITYGQIISVHPFGNMLCVAEVSGSTILDALEMAAAKLPGESGGFQHVSGMRFTIDLNVDSTVEFNNKGEFIGVTGDRRIKNVTVLNGETGEYEPLDPEKTYTLASHNYLLEEAGDGFTMFKGCTLLQDKVMIDNQVLITYIVETLDGNVGKEYAEPFGEGRITIVEKGEALPAEEPEATEPETTEPEATEPETTEPEATEPEATEPEATDAKPVENADAVSKTDEKPLERVYGRWHCDLCNSNFYSSPEIEDNQYVCRICGKTGGLHQIDAKGNPIVTANEDEEAASEVKDAVADEAEEVEKEAAETEAGDAIADAVEGAAASTEAAEPEAAEDTAEPETAEPAADAEASVEAPAILLGGWTLHKEEAAYVLPEAAQAAFDKALAENEEFTAKPIALLGQQVVAGMNYAVLAEVTPLIEGGDIVSTLQVLIIYADLQGNATLTDVLPFDLGTLSEGEYAALPDPTLAGGWAVPEEFEAATLPEDVQAAFDKA
ncbi:MAG: bifunctional metallophosphatase/5'-nucleotidase, partial [Clostridia bacterium]|nr:bifunctional metallophosphatase/5'-nucleotidase [Clostridia bacterium]